MHPAHIRQFDLNLLTAFSALLEERSVTRASKRLGLTQSATSRVLGRLREQLGDELLVRTRGGMLPTPRALELARALEPMLAELDELLGRRESFDPSRAARVFRLATADYPVAVVIPPLLARLEHEAPSLGIHVATLGSDLDGALESGDIDLALAPKRRGAAAIVWSELFTDRFVTLVRAGHPRVGRRLTLDRFCAEAHVVVAPETRTTTSAVDQLLAATGRSRRVALRVPNFFVAPSVVAESNLIATVPERLAARFAASLSLRILPTPVALQPFRIAMAWHERFRKDPGHAWLRRCVAAAVKADALT